MEGGSFDAFGKQTEAHLNGPRIDESVERSMRVSEKVSKRGLMLGKSIFLCEVENSGQREHRMGRSCGVLALATLIYTMQDPKM